MDTRGAIAKRIKCLCSGRGITPNKLSTISAVHQATIKSILNRERKDPGTVTIKSSATVWKSPSASLLAPQSSTHWNRE